MGIPGFYGSWLASYVKQAILYGKPDYISSLSFDLNGVIHDAIARIIPDINNMTTDEYQALLNTSPLQLQIEIQNAIANIILEIIAHFNPQDCLILAVDGVAPGAKLQQQRGRRFKAGKNQPLDIPFDRNAVTPGTEFMIELDNYLIRFIGSYRKSLPPKIIYSSHLVPGEGEHKIMEFYRRGEVSEGAAAKNGAVHILYGLDADLIMLSLLAPIEHIHLSRQNVQEVVNIDEVKKYIKTRSNNRETAIDDFIVMMFLIGNDFLPSSPSLAKLSDSVKLLLDIYAEGDYILTRPISPEGEAGTEIESRHVINWPDMKRFLQVVADREKELLAAAAVRPYKYSSRFLNAALIEGLFYPDTFREIWYQNALGPKGNQEYNDILLDIIRDYQPAEDDPEIAYQDITSISEVSQERIESMSADYLTTMEWVYLYYREGTSAINHDWAYMYYHAPLLSDIASTAQTVGDTLFLMGYDAYDGMIQFTALHQLLAVLPLSSSKLFPAELQSLIGFDGPIRDMFTENFIIELEGKNDDKEGIPIIPLIERRRIVQALAQIIFTPNRLQLWLPGTDKLYLPDTPEMELIQRQKEFLQRLEQSRSQKSTRERQFRAGRGQQGQQGRGRGRGQEAGRGRGQEAGRGAAQQYRFPPGQQSGRGQQYRFPPAQGQQYRFPPAAKGQQYQQGPRPPFTATGRGRGGRDTAAKQPVPLPGKQPTPLSTKLPPPTQTQVKGPSLLPAGITLPSEYQKVFGKGPSIQSTQTVPSAIDISKIGVPLIPVAAQGEVRRAPPSPAARTPSNLPLPPGVVAAAKTSVPLPPTISTGRTPTAPWSSRANLI